MVRMAARLVVSLSGLTADSAQVPAAALARAVELAAALDDRRVPLSQLFRPSGRGRVVDPGSALVGWLRERRACGDAIVLHGYDHSHDPLGTRLAGGLLGRRAEFAGLPRHEAGLRLIAARRALAVNGLGTDLFAAPRWLASEGTVAALSEHGFTVCADDSGVRLLRGPGGDTVLRARVLGFRAAGEKRPVARDRKAAEAWRCRVLEAEAVRIARRGGLVRIALRSKDLERPARVHAALAAIDAVLASGVRPGTYAPTEASRVA